MKRLKPLYLQPNLFYEQHFYVDKKIIQEKISAAELSPADVVLEIGAGTGSLTRELAKKVKKVITVEIDLRFKPFLKDLPSSVEVIFGDASKVITQRKDFNKIVANPPFQIIEPLLHYLCLTRQVILTVLTLPKKFIRKAQQHPIFSAFLAMKIIREVPKTAFFPPPQAALAIVQIRPHKKEDNLTFFQQKLYLQREKKLKNALQETLIGWHEQKYQKPLTKKKAKEMIEWLRLEPKLLNSVVKRISLKTFENITKKIIFSRLC